MLTASPRNHTIFAQDLERELVSMELAQRGQGMARRSLADKGVEAFRPRAKMYSCPDPALPSFHVRVIPSRPGDPRRNLNECCLCCAAGFELLHIDDFGVTGSVEVGQPRILLKAHALIEAARRGVAVGRGRIDIDLLGASLTHGVLGAGEDLRTQTFVLLLRRNRDPEQIEGALRPFDRAVTGVSDEPAAALGEDEMIARADALGEALGHEIGGDVDFGAIEEARRSHERAHAPNIVCHHRASPLEPVALNGALGKTAGEQGYSTLIVQEGGYRVRTLGTNVRNFFTGLVTGHSAARQVAPALARSFGQRPTQRDGLEWRSAVMADDVGRVRSLVGSTGFFNGAEVDIAADLVTERLSKGIRSGYHFILAERGSGLVAYACYGPIEGTLGSFDLYWIAVAPEEQRKGLGPQVFARAENAMRKAGAKKIYVDTSSSDRYAGTRGFYQRMGFEEDARLPDFYGPGDAKVIYVKQLDGGAAPPPH